MRVAVVGHVEWVTFLRVDVPPAPGVIGHGLETWEEPAGGGAVAAAELARLAGGSVFYTALADDPPGRASLEALARLHIDVRSALRPGDQRRAITILDPAGER